MLLSTTMARISASHVTAFSAESRATLSGFLHRISYVLFPTLKRVAWSYVDGSKEATAVSFSSLILLP